VKAYTEIASGDERTLMEHEGRIWFGDDDPSTAAQASVEIASDGRMVVRVGDSIAAEWVFEDVSVVGDHPVTELRVVDELVNFEPDDKGAWMEDIAAARMRVRLGQVGMEDGEAVGSQEMANTALVSQTPAGVAGGSYCPACGEPIDPRAEICVNCGVRQYALVTRPHKSKTTAGLLALFLGGIGAHHFYLGQTGLGILYLLFFWTFIPAIVAFFEALVFFFQSDASFDAKYNSVLISL